MGDYIATLKDVKSNMKPYEVWEKDQTRRSRAKEYLAQTKPLPPDKAEFLAKKAKAIIRASEIQDSRSENNCEDMEAATEAVTAGVAAVFAFLPQFLMGKCEKLAKFAEKSPIATSVFMFAPSVVLSVASILFGNHIQKKASRVGRYQARRDELNDTRNFVLYNEQQTAEAEHNKNNVKLDPDIVRMNRAGFGGQIDSIKNVYGLVTNEFSEYNNYRKQEDLNDDYEALKSGNYTPEELQQGKEDKELILETMKKINNSAEDYSEDVENVFETAGIFSSVIGGAAFWGLQKIIPVLKKVPAFIPGLAAGLGITLIGAAQQKQAAAIGRFKARKELLENPTKLYAYSEDDINSAPVTGETKKQNAIAKCFSFIPQYFKDLKEYKKYKNNEFIENEKLNAALKNVQVSEKQMTDAKNLQSNVFKAFEEMDEYSQKYSENTEAATQLGMQGVSIAISLSSILAPFGIIHAIKQGWIPFTGIIEKLSNWALKDDSPIKQEINKIIEVAKNDKDVLKNLNKLNSEELAKNTKITNSAAKIIETFAKDALPDLSKQMNVSQNPSAEQILKELPEVLKNIKGSMDKHFKGGFLVKYIRDLATEVLFLKGVAKEEATKNLPEEFQKFAKKVGIFDMPTLRKSGIFVIAGGFAGVVAAVYAFQGWLTNIQKKAGKIGVMQAMKKLDSPEIFVNRYKTAPGAQPMQPMPQMQQNRM